MIRKMVLSRTKMLYFMAISSQFASSTLLVLFEWDVTCIFWVLKVLISCSRQDSPSYCLWWCHHCICHQEFSTESTLLKILVHQVNRNVLCIFLLGWSISPYPSTSKYFFGNIYFREALRKKTANFNSHLPTLPNYDTNIYDKAVKI